MKPQRPVPWARASEIGSMAGAVASLLASGSKSARTRATAPAIEPISEARAQGTGR